MPVNHDAAAAIAAMVFSKQILVPGPELFGVRCTGSRSLAPDLGQPRGERCVHHPGCGLAQSLCGNESAPDVEKVLVVVCRPGLHTFYTCVGAKAEEAEQKPSLEGGFVHAGAFGSASEALREANAQVRLLEHVEKACPPPAPGHFLLENCKVLRLRLGIRGSYRNPVLAFLVDNFHLGVGGHPLIQRIQMAGQFLAERGRECLSVKRDSKVLVVGGLALLEVPRQILLWVPVPPASDNPNLPAAKLLPERFQDTKLVGGPV